MNSFEKLVVNNLYHGLFLISWVIVTISHEWKMRLGLLNDAETSDLALLKRLCCKDKFSSFSQKSYTFYKRG